MKQLRLMFMMVSFLFASLLMYGQGATTSSLTGRIVESKGQAMPGATILATHVPSGTTYGALTNNEGFFTIQGMRPGGPYKIEVSFVGYSKKTFTDITLLLGEAYVLKTDLVESASELGEVVVVGARPSAFGTERMGATSNINKQEMALIPSLNRSLGDYTKLSPYSTGAGYVGREAYTTNVTVDGANFNNNFGLSSGSLPGASGEPISMEAIEEIQVAVAPFDVTQSNFTGASVNAITKSGTNQFKASVYAFYRDTSMVGKKIRENRLKVSQSSKKAYGFTLGGPIIKDKLFFFLNAEKESTLTPGNTLLAMQEGRDPNDLNVNSRVQASDLQTFSQLLKDNYGYNTGKYESWGGDNEYNNKILARIDWNISKNHKFSFRYDYSASSYRSAPSNSGDATPSISGGRQSRTGGLSFQNSQYYVSSKLNSLTGELNSRFGQVSNKLLVAYTMYKQPRTSDSDVFPFIDIMSGSATPAAVMMSAGYELFSYKNNVDNNTFIVTDNVTYQLDRHNFTFGMSFEHQYFANSYLRQGTGYYRFRDLPAFQSFLNGDGLNKPYNANYDPINFAYTYPINGFTNPVAELNFGQYSTYFQDEYNALDNLKITAGVRVDLPMYFSGAVDNPALKNYSFRNGEVVDLSSWPEAKLLWSPRLGFTYDVLNNKSLKIRGGTGIFTGRIPFVWFTNQPTNSGMLQYQLVINSSGGAASQAQLARLPLLANAADLLKDESLKDIFPTSNPEGGRIAAIDKNFKLPQVWRSSLGFDVKLPLNIMLTLEGVYTKDLNSINFDNINLAPAASTVTEGVLVRPLWTNTSNATKYLTQPYQNVVIMRNTTRGQGYSLSAELDFPMIAGFDGMLAYSRSWGEEVAGKSGSDPFSAWQYRYVSGSSNSDELGLTLNNTPHRFIGSLSYSIEYAKFFGTSISLFYNGFKGGASSYYYYNDANGDGTTNDLMYIPRFADELIWSSVQDKEAYTAFAKQDPYLSKHQGEYALRNAAYTPWNERWDLRLLQDFKLKVGETANKLQFSLDIINVANLLDSSWGLNKNFVTTSPLSVVGKDAATGKLKVSMRKIGTDYIGSTYQDPNTVAATFAIQVGVRYIFN
jgi:Carboxypeptidase regulatory-like domain